MKNIWKYIAVAAVAALGVACAPQYPEVVPSAVPQASQLDVTIDVDQETNYATFTMNTPGVVPVWMFGDQLIDGKVSKKQAYTTNGLRLRFRAAGEYTVEVKAYNANGLSQGSIIRTFTMENTYKSPDEPAGETVEPLVPADFDLEGETNLWRSHTAELELWFSAGDWSGALTPSYQALAGNGISVVVPDGIGGSEWMGQTKIKSGAASSSEKTYDFSVTLEADEDMVVTVKLTGTPEGDSDSHAFFYDGQVKLTAGVPLVYRKAGIAQKESTENVMLVLDFGRSPAGSEISATDIIFQEHREANLWNDAVMELETWYSAAGWGGGIEADASITDTKGLEVVIPAGLGGDEWMGQNKLRTGIATSSEKTYAFSVELEADEDMTVTLKLTGFPEGDNDPHAFFYDGQVKLTAGQKLTYVKRDLTQKESCDNLMLVIDLGRSPAGASFTADGIIFMEQK